MVVPMDHDAAWTRLFEHPIVVAHLIRLALPELVDRLDLMTLEPLPTRWARNRRNAGRGQLRSRVRAVGAFAPRTGDRAWRVWYADGSGRSLILVLEFQSSTDSHMDLRSLEYSLLVRESEGRRLPDQDGGLRVLPIVLYSGGRRWSATDPRWAARDVEVSSTGGVALPLEACCILVDAHSCRRDGSQPPNIVASLLTLNVATDWDTMRGGLQRMASWLWDVLPPVRAQSIIDDLVDWVAICQPALPTEALDSVRRVLKHEEEPEVMALARMGREYPRALREEGRREGLAEGRTEGLAEGRSEGLAVGFAHERELLCRLAERKFNANAARRLAELLSDSTDPSQLAEVGGWIIDCATAGEFMGRVTGAGNGR